MAPFTQFDILRGVAGLTHAILAKPRDLAPHTGPDRDQAIDGRREVCSTLGLDFDLLTSPRQVHGVKVARIDTGSAGAGRQGRESALLGCDGLMTDLPGIPLIAFSADCCLLAIVDVRVHAVGLMHAGWRGVAGNGAAALVHEMCLAYGAVPGRMLAAIGPAAQVCCYEISDDLAENLANSPYCGRDVLVRRQNKWHLDMHAALVKQLARAGVPVEQIERSSDCTICDDAYFSYRREGPETGRNALLIGWTA
jgi:polyphenol oxidase